MKKTYTENDWDRFAYARSHINVKLLYGRKAKFMLQKKKKIGGRKLYKVVQNFNMWKCINKMVIIDI